MIIWRNQSGICEDMERKSADSGKEDLSSSFAAKPYTWAKELPNIVRANTSRNIKRRRNSALHLKS